MQRLTHCVLLALTLGACSSVERTPHPRPALPVPPAIQQRYELPGPVVEDTFVPLGGDDEATFWRGRLRCGDESAEFHVVMPRTDEPVPFALCLPILAGGEELMWIVGQELAARGYAAAWANRVASAMQTGQEAPDLERLFRRSVIHNRMVLAWSRRQHELVDVDRTALFGVSMGGLLGCALLAVEPEFDAAAICLAGAGVPDLFLSSKEGRVRRWRRARELDGLPSSEIARLAERTLVSDPALLGAYVPTEQVLLVATTLDTVMPWRNQTLLWEALGRPERVDLPLGHYSAAVAILSVVAEADTFYRSRFQIGREVRPL